MDDLSITDTIYHNHLRFRKAIEEFASTCSGRVLDVGCGSKPHRNRFDVEEYVGMDVAQEGYDPDLLGDAHHLPFPDGYFDHVVAFAVLEHLPDPMTFFQEISRVLGGEGTIFVSTNQSFWLHMKPNDYFRFTRFGLRQLAESTGFAACGFYEGGNALLRIGQKINLGLVNKLPDRIADLLIGLNNLLFYPARHLDPLEDYTTIAITAEVEPPHSS